MIDSIPNTSLEQDEGGLWEMGVVLPFSNMDMAKFEQQFSLSRAININDTAFYIKGHSTRIKPLSRVYIGPSSDPTRDDDSNLMYFGNYELFKVVSITADGDEDRVVITALSDGYKNKFENSYIEGDPVVFRPLAESWEFLADNQIAGVTTIADPRTDINFIFSREDSLDGFKGYSQGITTNAELLTPIDVGITQAISGNKGNILHLIKNKTLMISTWVRAQYIQNYNPLLVDEGLVRPYIIASFYNKSDALKVNSISGATFIYGTDQIPGKYWNVHMADRVVVPPESQSMRIGAYGTFTANSYKQFMKLFIDDIVAEHCAETSQEQNGRYVVDLNPAIGISTSNRGSSETTKGRSGIVKDIKNGDPRLKLSINSVWHNRPSFFINDMRKLQNWNAMGFPIALRTKMPGTLPNVLFCNIDVDVDYFHTGGNSRGDVQIRFDEVAV